MEKPKISVILSVYNTNSDILSKTIDSILSQSLSDFELVIVDDGSNNGCEKICDEYADRDKRIVVVHKANGGICDARNCGLNIARGEYITFCDHDDLYEKDKLSISLALIQKYNADMVIVGKKVETGINVFYKGLSLQSLSRSEIVKNMGKILAYRLLENVWTILYKRNVIGDDRFDTAFKCGQEDYNFNISVIKKVNKVISISEPLCIHFVRKDISTSAKIHTALVYDMAATNRNIYDLIEYYTVTSIADNHNLHLAEIGQLRMCVAYAVKSHFRFSEFKALSESLKFHVLENTGFIFSKEQFVYWALKHKHYRLLYCVLKMAVKL